MEQGMATPCSCGLDARIEHQCSSTRSPSSSSNFLPHTAPFPAQVESRPRKPSSYSLQRRPHLLRLPAKVLKKRSKSSLHQARIPRQFQLRGLPADVFHYEPFNAYPIPSIGCVPQTIEYCEYYGSMTPLILIIFELVLQVWAPQQSKPFAIDGHPDPWRSLLFPFALQHAVLFESVVAVGRASQVIARGQSPLDDMPFLHHFDNARRALQIRVNSTASFADDLIMSLGALSTAEVTKS